MEWIALPHIDSVAQVSGAATRLELTWKRWRATRGLPDGGDPMAAYVGHSREDSAGQARVVINVDAADALLFAEMIWLLDRLPASRPSGSEQRAMAVRSRNGESTASGGTLLPRSRI
jgi:hypothetical protein